MIPGNLMVGDEGNVEGEGVEQAKPVLVRRCLSLQPSLPRACIRDIHCHQQWPPCSWDMKQHVRERHCHAFRPSSSPPFAIRSLVRPLPAGPDLARGLLSRSLRKSLPFHFDRKFGSPICAAIGPSIEMDDFHTYLVHFVFHLAHMRTQPSGQWWFERCGGEWGRGDWWFGSCNRSKYRTMHRLRSYLIGSDPKVREVT